jgi:hypothetical protein
VLGFFFLMPLLGINAEPVDPLPSGKIELSTKESAALNRLIQRLKQQHGNGGIDSAALLKLLTCPDAQQLEDMYTSSLQQRGGKELKGTTVQDQVSGCLRTAGMCEGQRTLGPQFSLRLVWQRQADGYDCSLMQGKLLGFYYQDGLLWSIKFSVMIPWNFWGHRFFACSTAASFPFWPGQTHVPPVPCLTEASDERPSRVREAYRLDTSGGLGQPYASRGWP